MVTLGDISTPVTPAQLVDVERRDGRETSRITVCDLPLETLFVTFYAFNKKVTEFSGISGGRSRTEGPGWSFVLKMISHGVFAGFFTMFRGSFGWSVCCLCLILALVCGTCFPMFFD